MVPAAMKAKTPIQKTVRGKISGFSGSLSGENEGRRRDQRWLWSVDPANSGSCSSRQEERQYMVKRIISSRTNLLVWGNPWEPQAKVFYEK